MAGVPANLTVTNLSNAPAVDPVAVYSSALWRRSLEAVKDTEEYQKYCAILKHGDATILPISDPDEIAKRALEVRQLTIKSRSGRFGAVRNVLDKVIDILTGIKDVGSAVTTLNPYASVAWGALQFFLQAAVNDRQIRSLCWENLERMTYLTGRYATFEEVYTVHSVSAKTRPQLENALVDLYSAILRFQMAVVQLVGSRLSRLKAAFRPTSDSVPQQMLDEIQRHEAEVIKLQATLDREINDASLKSIFDASHDLKSSLRGLETQLNGAKHSLDHISKLADSSLRNKVLEWISPIKYEDVHKKKIVLTGTGEWLLAETRFLEWYKPDGPSTIWLHGFMGCGKSCLTHKIIENLRQNIILQQGESLTFFYCVGTDARSKADIEDIESILRSLVQQMASNANNPEVQSTILSIYDRDHHKSHLSKQQCLDLIIEMINKTSVTTIIIDGLDECSQEVQQELMLSLRSCTESSTSMIKVLISSRFTPFIQDLLKDWDPTKIDVAENNSGDIRTLITRTVADSSSRPGLRQLYLLEKDGPGNQTDGMIEKLVELAQGMFRWVDLAFKFLHRSRTSREFKRRLSKLGHLQDLFSLYDAIYDDIMQREDECVQAVIKTILRFMLQGEVLQRNLFVVDLRKDNTLSEEDEAVQGGILHILEAATFVETGRLRPCYTAEQVVALCPSFLGLGASKGYSDGVGKHRPSSTLSLPHFTVREYLVAKHPNDYSDVSCHAQLAKICMGLFVKLNRNDFSQFNRGFARYAALFWVRHLLHLRNFAIQTESSLNSLINDSVFHETLNDFLLKSHVTRGFLTWHNWMKRHERKSAPVFYNHRSPAAYLVSKPPSSMFARILVDVGWRSIHPADAAQARTAAALGDFLFLDKGLANPRILAFAAFLGNVQAVEWLVQRGYDASQVDRLGYSPLHYFLCRKRISTWNSDHLFPDAGVKLLEALYPSEEAIHAMLAANQECLFTVADSRLCEPDSAVIRFLVNSGADIIPERRTRKGKGRDTAFHFALARNNEVAANILLPLFLARTFSQRSLDTALRLAAEANVSENTIRAIIAKGASLSCSNALQRASLRGNGDVVQILLAMGANVNARDRADQSPLYLASLTDGYDPWMHESTNDHFERRITSAKRHQNTVQILVAAGAHVNMQGGEFGNALQAASFMGSEDIVQTLLATGADINAKGGKYGSALQAASYRGEEEVVRILLAAGADVNEDGGEHGSALQAASYYDSDRGIVPCRRDKVVRMLLDAGADVNARGGKYGSALRAALYDSNKKMAGATLDTCNKEVVQTLLDAGADINAEGGECGKALRGASYRGEEEVVLMLLKAGVDVNAEGGEYGSALQAASYKGHKEVVQMLLDAGADVNAEGGEFDSALRAASYKHNEEVVQILLDAGAEDWETCSSESHE